MVQLTLAPWPAEVFIPLFGELPSDGFARNNVSVAMQSDRCAYLGATLHRRGQWLRLVPPACPASVARGRLDESIFLSETKSIFDAKSSMEVFT